MALQYKLYKNNNSRNAGFGKWYARATMMDTVDINQLSESIEANCSVKRSDVLAVISELVVVMKKELQNSNRMKLDRFGTFKLGLTSEGSTTVKGFNASEKVKGVHVIFQPEVTISADGRRTKSLIDGCRVAELPKNDVEDEEDVVEP